MVIRKDWEEGREDGKDQEGEIRSAKKRKTLPTLLHHRLSEHCFHCMSYYHRHGPGYHQQRMYIVDDSGAWLEYWHLCLGWANGLTSLSYDVDHSWQGFPVLVTSRHCCGDWVRDHMPSVSAGSLEIWDLIPIFSALRQTCWKVRV